MFAEEVSEAEELGAGEEAGLWRELYAFVEIPKFLTGRGALMRARQACVDEEGFARFLCLLHGFDSFVCDPAFLAFVKGKC